MKYETNPKQPSGKETASGDSRIDGERKTSFTRVRDKDCVKNRVKRAKIVRFTLC